MAAYLVLPLDFLKFWYLTAPREILAFFWSFNGAFLQTFSLFLMLRTFFQPVKNEYRKGLVAFSIGMGMVLKSWIIFVDLLLLLVLLFTEIAFLLAFLLWPIATVWFFIT